MQKCQKHKWNNKGKARKSNRDAFGEAIEKQWEIIEKTMEVLENHSNNWLEFP